MADNTTTTARYTKVYEGMDEKLGEIIVCIEGEHDLNDKGVIVLDHAFHVFLLVDEKPRRLDDPETEEFYISLTKSYFYMTESVVVTSEHQPTVEDIEGKETIHLDVPGYGVVAIEHCGVVEQDDDMYQISVSHPGPGVYLAILLKIIRTRPLTFRSVDLKDTDLTNGIIDCYLVEIGAIEEVDASGDDADEEDEDDPNFC